MIDLEELIDHINETYCDIDERPKLRRAFAVLCEHLPEATYYELPQLIIFAPAPWKYGSVSPVPNRLNRGPVGALIYFAPALEEMSQEQSNFTVAHEFAHVALGHYKLLLSKGPTDYENVEDGADALVKQWGYEIPAYRIKAAN
jgi:IrrE N-terminal-like domain